MANKQKKKRNKKSHIGNFIYLAVIVIIGVTVLSVGLYETLKKNAVNSPTSASENKNFNPDDYGSLFVKFIDIGQGDAILINFPDGKNMLIDFGKVDTAVVDENLTVNGEKLKIDYLVATHPDKDHIGELPYIYQHYDVKYSYRPYVLSEYSASSSLPADFNEGIDINKKTKIYHQYIESVYTYNQNSWEFFTDDSDFKGEGDFTYSVDFMMPYIKELSDYSAFKIANNFSAIIMVEYAGRKVLFMGDAENNSSGTGAEDKFRIYYETNDRQSAECNVLKVGHHGSSTSSSKQFLELVKPEYSVISCGVSNSYNHPTEKTLNNLINIRTDIFRTDLQGNITLEIAPDGEMTFNVETHANDKYKLNDGPYIQSIAAEILAEKAAAKKA